MPPSACAPAKPQPQAPPTGSEHVWVPIGPSVVLNGQAGSNPRVAGRVRDVAVSADGRRAYAATANGGIWYSGDAGESWSPLGNWMPTPQPTDAARRGATLTIGCVLVTFGGAVDGSGDTVFAGTGEITAVGSPLHGGKAGGVGVLRLSTPLLQVLADPFGQNHWQREASNLAGVGLFRLARDPQDPNRLVAATSAGLFTRGGAFVEHAEWQRVDVGAGSRRASDVAWVDTSQGGVPSSRLWVAVVGESDTRTWTSTNGVAGPFQPVDLPHVVNDQAGRLNARLALAPAPSNASVVYVLGSGPRLWRMDGAPVPSRVQRFQVTGVLRSVRAVTRETQARGRTRAPWC